MQLIVQEYCAEWMLRFPGNKGPRQQGKGQQGNKGSRVLFCTIAGNISKLALNCIIAYYFQFLQLYQFVSFQTSHLLFLKGCSSPGKTDIRTANIMSIRPFVRVLSDSSCLQLWNQWTVPIISVCSTIHQCLFCKNSMRNVYCSKYKEHVLNQNGPLFFV